MANIAEYMSQLQTLTQKNLEILQAINDSFFTKREHLTVAVGDTRYVMPSFISLENKINSLTENFNNLVFAPSTGEAFFNYDGNSRAIEVRGYTCTPNRLNIDVSKITGFSVEQNDIFKDFMTPNPYITVDLHELPNDITTVNVRKVAVKSDLLKNVAQTALGTNNITNYAWADLYKILSLYKEDVDYVMYDTVRQLPIRKNIGSGTYTIKSIDKDITDEYLDNYITITFWDDLKYKLFDETIEKYIKEGDELVTYDDSAKMRVVEVNAAKRQMTVKVLNGDYLNLVPDATGPNEEGVNEYISDLSRLKFFLPVDYDKDKYINIPLEEDQYVFVFVAPLNSRMNVQAPWGEGLVVDSYNLLFDEDGQTTFKNYYEQNVRNVGDILFEISSFMSNTIMKYSEDDFGRFAGYKPIVDPDNLRVVQINTHLNNSITAQNIRALYTQKQEYKRELNEVNEKIAEINSTLAEIAFTDTTGVRAAYEAQLSQHNQRKNEINTSITKLLQEIATAANDSVLPLENAKYHIRGYYNWNNDDEEILKLYKEHIHGIKVQYRYKNVDHTTGTALSMQSGKFIFSDWNDMPSFKLQKEPYFEDGFKFNYPQIDGIHDNGKLNEPSFNQIDIPISQGETVDIRLKIVWDFGYPFIETTSDWSAITNIEFPDELLKDVQVLDIVAENNNEIENNHFTNMLKEEGIIAHVGDKLVDQDVTFFHKPESIASGFYTEERRVIPLRDKLAEFQQQIISLQDMVHGTNSDSFEVSIVLNDIENVIQPDKENVFILPAYSDTGCSSKTGNEAVYTMMATIQIANKTNHSAYLYSMFLGKRGDALSTSLQSKFKVTDFIVEGENDYRGVWLGSPNANYSGNIVQNTSSSGVVFTPQTCNQWINFRTKCVYNGSEYYKTGDQFSVDNVLSADQGYQLLDVETGSSSTSTPTVTKMSIYPYLSDTSVLLINGDNIYNKLELAPSEAVMIPVIIQYIILGTKTNISKTISFDIRPSLYSDPTNFVITLQANQTDSVQEKTAKAEKARVINQATIIDASRVQTGTLQSIITGINKARYKKILKNNG